MADQDNLDNEKEHAPTSPPAVPSRDSGESQINKAERTNTDGSSKATAAAKERTGNTAKAHLARVRHAMKRTMSTDAVAESSSKKAETSEQARSTTTDKANLKLVSSGGPEVLVDIVAIRGYYDDSSTAWTFNLGALRRRVQDLPESFNQPATETRKAPPEPHDKQSSRAREQDAALPQNLRSATVDAVPDLPPKTQPHISIQETVPDRGPLDPSKQGGASEPAPDPPVAETLHRAPPLALVENNTIKDADHNDTSKQPSKLMLRSALVARHRRKSRTEGHVRYAQDESISFNTTLKEEEVTMSEPSGPVSVNWLVDHDMLPQQAPWARIFSFEYPRQHKERSSKPMRLQHLVSGLLIQLMQAREHVRDRPILFIVHDFGFAILLDLLFSTLTFAGSFSQVHLQQSVAGVFVFLTPPDGASGNIRISKYVRSQTMQERVLHDGLPYAETRNPDYMVTHLQQIESLRHLRPKKGPMPFLHLMNDDGKQFKDPADKAFLGFVRSLTKATRARLLLEAAKGGKEELLQRYDELGWDLNLSDSIGRSALHFAIMSKRNRMKTLLFLLNCKDVKVDAKDVRGQTALHYAVEMLSRPQEAIAMLVDNGADATIKDNNGSTVLDIARRRNIQQSLKTFRAITGPSSDPGLVLQLPDPDMLDELKQLAAEDCLMAMAEFFKVTQDGVPTEKFIIQRPSVFQALYGMYPDDILGVARRKTDMSQENRVCRWLHIPANHTGWVDGLFARLGLAKESIQVDQHSGKTYWSNYLRPHSRTFKAVRQALPSTSNGPQREVNFEVPVAPDAPEVHGTLLYMPFLTSERHCDQRVLYDTVVGDERSLKQDFYYIAGRHLLPPEPPEPPDESGSDDSEDSGQERRDSRHTESQVGDDGAPASGSDVPASDQEVTSDAESWTQSATLNNDRNGSDDARLRSERELVYAFRDSLTGLGRPLHVRRTLDQSHYLMLEDTTKRDRDQVVLRRQQDRIGSKNGPDADLRGADAADLKDEDPLVMVDQLWLWVMDDTVISSFPRSWPQPDWECECDVLDRLIAYINATHRRGPIRSSHDLAKLIIKHCVDVFNHPQHEDHLHPLSLHDAFETSAGIVADEETELFREFEVQVFLLHEIEVPRDQKPGRKPGSLALSYIYYDEGASTAESSQDGEHPAKGELKIDSQAFENRLLDRLFDIKREIEQLDEAKDVRDELRMILRIFGEQKRVLGDWFENLTPSSTADTTRGMERSHNRQVSTGSVGVGTLFEGQEENTIPPRRVTNFNDVAEEAYATIQSNLKDFTRMLDHVTATEKGINQLLNLKQKEANSLEARFARKSAAAATKQGNTVLFFTIVTIIFGSLSFITTFFALNVTAFPLDSGTKEPVWGLKPVIGLIIGLSLGLSIPFIIMALTINSTMALGARVVKNVRSFLAFINLFRFLLRRQREMAQAGAKSSNYSYYTPSSLYYSDAIISSRSGTSVGSRRGNDTTGTSQKKISWMSKAGNSLRRLRPRLKAKENRFDHSRDSGSGRRSVYSV